MEQKLIMKIIREKLLKERAKDRYRELSENEKDAKKQYQKDIITRLLKRNKNIKNIKKIIVTLKNNNVRRLIFFSKLMKKNIKIL